MASIKLKFRSSAIAGQEGAIYYQIIHERKVRQVPSGFRVYPHEWDDGRSMVAAVYGGKRGAYILSVREKTCRDVDRFAKIVRRLAAVGLPYTADDVVDGFYRYADEYKLSNFMSGIIKKLRQDGRIRTSETYAAALKNFRKFLANRRPQDGCCGEDDIMLDCLTSEIMESYQAWLISSGIMPNTVSFYARILRAAYNRAVERGAVEDLNPFKRIYTGIGKTVKRALPLASISKIKALDLPPGRALDFARDMFMMSFYLRGMSFIDMAFLKKTDLKNGYVFYHRRKTGQQLIIEWTKEMQMLLAKYPENESDYLLPIIRNPGTNERCAYRNVGYNINHNLKTIAGMVGITIPLTLYVARHSWASAAKAKGIPLSVISEGMGHDSEATTQIDLASLDTSAVDKANSLILKSL